MESQPLMGSRGESESEGGGRRIQLKKNDITCAGRGRKREREIKRGRGVGGGIEVARASGGETALDGLAAEQMWMRGGGHVKGRDREKREGASLLIGW